MNVLLIRHTRLKGNEGICYGQTDFPLADTFEGEFGELIAQLPWKPGRVYTSPLERCRVLAARLARGAAVIVDPRLAEIHFGAWEGKAWNDLRGAEVEAWMARPFEARPPGGETAPEFVARVRDFRAEVLRGGGQGRAEKRVAIITHAGVIRVWRSLETGVPLEDAFKQSVPHGCVIEVPAVIGR